jgi:ribosomal protein L7/L12
MSNVLVEGWQDQRNPKPVSLVDVMRRHAGLSLPAAKKLLDAFVEHGQVVVELQSAEQAKAFVEDAQAIGAVVRVVQSDD